MSSWLLLGHLMTYGRIISYMLQKSMRVKFLVLKNTPDKTSVVGRHSRSCVCGDLEGLSPWGLHRSSEVHVHIKEKHYGPNMNCPSRFLLWTFGSQLVALFWNVLETLKGRPFLEEVGHTGKSSPGVDDGSATVTKMEALSVNPPTPIP